MSRWFANGLLGLVLVLAVGCARSEPQDQPRLPAPGSAVGAAELPTGSSAEKSPPGSTGLAVGGSAHMPASGPAEGPASVRGEAPAGGSIETSFGGSTEASPGSTIEPSPGSTELPADAAAGFCWPRFHGPANDNCSPEKGLLRVWPEGGPPLVWTAKGLGGGYSSVSIAGGLIYTAGNIDGKTMITALDLNGNVRWQQPNGPAWTGEYPGTRSTPTIDGQRLYHQSPLGNLVCMRAATGERLWGLNVLETFGSKNIPWALAESLLIDGPHVISTPGGPQTCVVALDKMTGQTVWQSASAEGDLAGYCSPGLVEYQGKRLILTMTARAVVCVDADTGKLYWRFPHKTAYDINVLTPIFVDGWVFISSGYRSGSRMLKMSVSGDEVSVEEVWINKDLDNHHGGVVLRDGFLYGSAHSGNWVCLDWTTGQTRYKERGVGKGSLTYADGMLYTLSERREVGLVPATPEKHEVVSRFELPEGGEGPSWAHPVVCGGRLYIRHGDFLYCYDVRAR